MSNQTINSVQISLEEKIYNEIRTLVPGVPAVTLRNIANNVATEYSNDMVQDVNLSTNKQLNEIPKNITGPINPVNLTNSNNGPQDIFNNVQNIIQTQHASSYTDKVSSSVINQLKNLLQPGQLNNLNLNNLNNNLPLNLSSTISSTINTALNGSLASTFSTRNNIPEFIPGVSNLFENNDSNTALEKIDEQFNISSASQALVEAQQFKLNNSENNEKLEVLSKGFTDPQANYPTKEYVGISETNKLAQGDIRGTIVQKKNNERMIGAKLPYGESWDQPESPYRGEYPYNKVTQTESGHIIEVDDTPGSERLHVYHKSGTFIEIDANGSIVKRAKGSSYEIIDRNGKISIAGKADISINGACNIFVGNDANIEVEGDVNLTCHNDITAQAGGTLNMSAKEEINFTSSKVNIEAYDELNMKGNVALNLHSSNVIHMHSNADIKVETVSSYYLKSSDSLYFETLNETHIKSAGDLNLDTDSKIYLDSGTADSSTSSIIAGSSNIGILSGRKDVFDNTLPDPQPLTLADNKSLLLEEETQSTSNYNQQKTVIITSGYATASDIDSTPVVISSETPSSSQSIIVIPDDKLLTVNQLPGNYNLSPNFTVESLSSKAAVTKDVIRAHSSLSYGSIVYNLQGIALNILEPIKKVYPGMFVTSAFRDPGNSSNSSTSQHPKGQAVDIQFKGANKEDYYDLSIKIAKIIKYDQLILEYCNYTQNPWIHISFSVEKNKGQILTFFNHKKHSDGLSNLA